ncbi:septum formation initiator family protein [Alkaliphilus transvaalensis]|uniref:septum formation initiator family protein n=1 Tax=Alkaliphilus transvaalensis TaxID=114628 RepID=UPI000478ABB6|nr:cell division protein FtsL [Alkaliphilus transvaalensis]
MEVARKEYYQLQEQQQLNLDKKKQKKIKPQKSYRLEKVMATLGIMTILAMSLPLLLRYTAITEVKHQIHRLDQQLDQMENQREKLKIEMERVSKSRAIEEAATERLGMNYPSQEDTFYVSIDQTTVAMMNQEINRRVNASGEEPMVGNTNPLSKMLNRIGNILNI